MSSPIFVAMNFFFYVEHYKNKCYPYLNHIFVLFYKKKQKITNTLTIKKQVHKVNPTTYLLLHFQLNYWQAHQQSVTTNHINFSWSSFHFLFFFLKVIWCYGIVSIHIIYNFWRAMGQFVHTCNRLSSFVILVFGFFLLIIEGVSVRFSIFVIFDHFIVFLASSISSHNSLACIPQIFFVLGHLRQKDLTFKSFAWTNREMATNDVPCCEPRFWMYLLICVGLVAFAGLMSGLTLGLMSLSLVDLEVLAKSGRPDDRKNAGQFEFKAHAARLSLSLVEQFMWYLYWWLCNENFSLDFSTSNFIHCSHFTL